MLCSAVSFHPFYYRDSQAEIQQRSVLHHSRSITRVCQPLSDHGNGRRWKHIRPQLHAQGEHSDSPATQPPFLALVPIAYLYLPPLQVHRRVRESEIIPRAKQDKLRQRPHPFVVADEMFDSLRSNRTSQALVLKGLSGGGKVSASAPAYSFSGTAFQS